MKRIESLRESMPLDQLNNNFEDPFCFKRNPETGIEYFPASIIENTDK